MKRFICMIVIIMFAMLLTGCDNGRRSTAANSQGISPHMTVYAKEFSYNFYYVVDEKTGVVYIAFEGYRKGGITVALNSDGTPMTIDQLGLGGE